MNRNRTLCFLSIILVFSMPLILSGCSGSDKGPDDSSQASIPAKSFKGEMVNGDSQQRVYTFTELNGVHQETLTVQPSTYLKLEIEVKEGTLSCKLTDPETFLLVDLNVIPANPQTQTLLGPFAGGTYSLELSGSDVDGQVKLHFYD